jgi:dihydrofolate reductase
MNFECRISKAHGRTPPTFPMKLIIIAALAKNRVIGKDGKLPWHISEDLQRFKRLTTGHTVLMGRKTFDSLGKPLPHRRNVVLSSRDLPGVETFRSIDDALEALKTEELVFVIGGGHIFEQMIARADALYLTVLDNAVDGDTYFPVYEHLIGPMYQLTSREEHEGFSFEDYVRKD